MRAPRAPAPRSPSSTSASSGRSDSAAGSRSLCSARASSSRGPAASSASPAGSGDGASGPQAIQLRVDRGRAQPLLGRDQHERHRRQRHRLHPLAGPGDDRVAGAHLARHVAAQARGHLSQGRLADRRQPLRRTQHRRGVGAASAEAGGNRDALVDRDPQRRWPAARRPERGQRARRQVLALHAGADHLVAVGLLDRELVGEVDRGEQRRQRVHPVRPGRPDAQHQIHLRRGALGHRRSSSRRRNSSDESRSARASSGCPSSARAARAASRIPSGAPGARASEPASVLRRWANAACTSSDSRGRRAGAVAPEHHQRGVHVGLGVEHRARHLAHHLHLAGQLRQHRGGAVGLAARRRREAVPHLALHHRHEQGSRGQLLDGLEQHRRGHAVGQVGHHLGGRGLERAEVELHGVREVQGGVAERIERLAQRRLQRAIDLDHVQVRDARRQVFRKHP